MRIKIGDGLLLLNLLAIVLVIGIILFPSSIVRIILGIPFILFSPGYVLMTVLYPRKLGIGDTERVVFSIGLSMAIVAITGYILNYTPWGISGESILYSILSFIFIGSVVAWFRKKRLLEKERFNIEFKVTKQGWGGGIRNRALSIILVLAILGALGIMGYVIATPKIEERFTEFYILDLQGKVVKYPKEIAVGEEERVIVGITNHEYETVEYWIEVRINGIRNNEMGSIALNHDEIWEGKVSFTPQIAGENQQVEFLLYKNGQAKPCLEPLRLWLSVKG
ncbi:DUF1616 domain-containing protein [Chloroflexota bacterium]